MKGHSDRLAGCVILYHPDTTLENNIATYLMSINKLYLIDNSDIKSEVLLDSLKRLNGVVYIDNQTNKGVATALNKAIELASRDGFEWLLTMDQDSSFADSRFFKAFENFKDKSQVAIFSPVHNQDGELGHDSNLYSEKEIVMTSGNILNIQASTQIGPFLDKLFIDEVDHEYCLRAKRKGFKIIEFSNLRLTHSLGKTLVHNTKKFNTHNATRIYYITRNGLYVITRYLWFFPEVAFQRSLNLIKIYVNILFYQDEKLLKFSAGLKGIFHFTIGRYGKK